MAFMAGRGTVLKMGINEVAWVVNITPPQLSRDTIDVELLDPADDYKQFLVGLADGGEVSFSLHFDPAQQTHTSLLDAFNNATLTNFEIVLPDGTTKWSFSGYITEYSPSEIAENEVIDAEITVKVVGKPTLAVGTGV